MIIDVAVTSVGVIYPNVALQREHVMRGKAIVEKVFQAVKRRRVILEVGIIRRRHRAMYIKTTIFITSI